jgi:flagellar biogenesis protein FliO
MYDILSLIFPMTVVVVIILAAYYTTRFIAKKQNAFTSGKIIRVIERVNVGRETFLLIVEVNGKPYLMSSTNSRVEILEELPPETLENCCSESGKNDFAAILMTLSNKVADFKDKGWGK